jgi:hypothetical protein
MAQEGDYNPCFEKVPEDWEGRWRLLRTFVAGWHGIPLGTMRRPGSRVTEEETKLGRTLPPSFREWISFSDELLDGHWDRVWRDCYEVRRLEGHPAVSLMIQGEADTYWAVREDLLSEDDPPVDSYSLDYDAPKENSFAHKGQYSPRITSFVLKHLSYTLRGRGGRCFTEVEPTAQFRSQMRQSFAVSSRLDDIHVFENRNLVAVMFPDPPGPRWHLQAEAWKLIPSSVIPNCIRSLPKKAVSGIFDGEPGKGPSIVVRQG